MAFSSHFSMGNRSIGSSCPCYIVAEISCNHNGHLEEALRIVHASKEAGADAVKLQTYTPDTITRAFKTHPKGTVWEKIDLYSLYEKAYTPWHWQKEIKKEAHKIGLEVFSSPFDETAVDFLLNELDVSAFKVASFEAVDIPLLKKIAQTGRPVILSTGMLTYLELMEAVQTLEKYGTTQLLLLHCNSGYPALFEEAHLETIKALQTLFDFPIGLSDHTLFSNTETYENPLPHITPLEAVKRGACFVEAHIIMDRQESKRLMEQNEGGFDWMFSRTPEEFKKMVTTIRSFEKNGHFSYNAEERIWAEKTTGTVRFTPTEREQRSLENRPSLWAVEDIKKGDPFIFAAEEHKKEEGNFDSIRPAGGLHCRFASHIEGKKATQDISKGTPLDWDMISF